MVLSKEASPSTACFNVFRSHLSSGDRAMLSCATSNRKITMLGMAIFSLTFPIFLCPQDCSVAEKGVKPPERLRDPVIALPSLLDCLIDPLQIQPEKLKLEPLFWPKSNTERQMQRRMIGYRGRHRLKKRIPVLQVPIN
jgi:hypothetical protein